MSWLPSSESTFRLVSVSCSCTRPGSSSFRPSLRACWRTWWQCPCPSRNPTIQRIGSTTSLKIASLQQSSPRLVFGHISALLPDAYQGAIAATDGNFDCARIVQSLIVSEPDVAVLQYTSGSTSKPKGVVLCNANIFANLRQIEVAFGHTCESSGVIWLPHYHDMGLIGGILQPLFAGFPVTLLSPISFIQRPLRWLQAIHKYRATTSGGPNFAYDLCVKKAASLESHIDLSSWDLAFNGAEPVRASTLNAFSAAFAHAGFVARRLSLVMAWRRRP